jgi:N-acetylglutamate synthase-like GNAT family acetyltransferase
LKSNNSLLSHLSIRRADASDAPVIAAITDAAYSKWIPLIGRKPLPMTVDYNVAVDQHMIDLAGHDGKIVGLIEMINERDHLMIENLAVLPEYQGQGIGQFLLLHADTAARALNFQIVRLLTNGRFESNVEFYARHGFSIDRQEPFMGGTTVHMIRQLT